jgi:hypothetical protein
MYFHQELILAGFSLGFAVVFAGIYQATWPV